MSKINNEQFKEWEKAIKGWESALKKGDKEVADIMQKRACEAYEQYKSEMEYQDRAMDSNAAELGDMFESVLPVLFVKNKRAVSDVLKLIKEDKNIKSQLQFFEAMKNYDGAVDAAEYVNESVNLASSGLDIKTLKESNKKLGSLIIKHNIKGEELNEDKRDFFNAGTYLLTHKKKLNNLSEIAKNRNVVVDYINTHKKESVNESINIKKLTEDFDKKMATLNEAERALVQDIINNRSSVAETKQLKFFNDLKEKCIVKIDKLMLESNDIEKESLNSIKESVMAMTFNKDSIIKDTAKLLEIGAVLSDNDNKKYM